MTCPRPRAPPGARVRHTDPAGSQRGITSGGWTSPVTPGYTGTDHRHRESWGTGCPVPDQGLREPTGIPQVRDTAADPLVTRLHVPPLPATDSPQAAGSNFPSNIGLGTEITGSVECLVRLEAEAAADDLLLDLGGAAEDRSDALSRQSSQSCRRAADWCSRRSRPGSVWSVRAAAVARCDLGGDHAPWDRLAASQRPEPRRGPDDHAEPAAADIPAVDTDVDFGELIAAQVPQVLVMHDAGDGSQVRSCSREPSRSDQYLGRGEDAHDDSMGTCSAR